jgi:hypothetical protein
LNQKAIDNHGYAFRGRRRQKIYTDSLDKVNCCDEANCCITSYIAAQHSRVTDEYGNKLYSRYEDSNASVGTFIT